MRGMFIERKAFPLLLQLACSVAFDGESHENLLFRKNSAFASEFRQNTICLQKQHIRFT